MSERFAAASGRRVISRTSADELGSLAHIVIDLKRCQVALLVVGKGRHALLVAWEQVTGFGPDAVMIADESAVQEPRDDREQAAADGKLELVGKRALSDAGNDVGTITDVVFDPDTGAIESILVDDREEPAASLIGAGSFAVIVVPWSALYPSGSDEATVTSARSRRWVASRIRPCRCIRGWSWRVGRASGAVPGGQRAVGGLGPWANDTAGERPTITHGGRASRSCS